MATAAAPLPEIDPTLVAPAKLACVKALGIMMSNTLAKSCLCAAAVAHKILMHYKLPHAVRTGYSQLPGAPVSTPHVWVESPGGLITDLTFSEPFRAVYILGQAFSFNEDAVNPYYTDQPEFAVPANSLSLAALGREAQDLDAYLARGPPYLRRNVDTVMEKALDGQKEVTFTGLAAELLGEAHVDALGPD